MSYNVDRERGDVQFGTYPVRWSSERGRWEWASPDNQPGWSLDEYEGNRQTAMVVAKQQMNPWEQRELFGYCVLCGWMGSEFMSRYAARRSLERHVASAAHRTRVAIQVEGAGGTA